MAIGSLSSSWFNPIDLEELRLRGGAFPGPFAPLSPLSPFALDPGGLDEKVDALPEGVKERVHEFLEARRSEGQTVQTPEDLRRLLQQLHQREGGAKGARRADGAQGAGDQDVAAAELLQMLIDYLSNFSQNDRQRSAPPRSVGSLSPSGGSGGGSGGGHTHGGAPTSSGGGATSGAGGVSPSSAPTSSADLKGNTNAQKAFNYFVQKGLTPEQSAGIVANLQAESGVKPGQHQIGGPAFGIAQWEGGRQTNLKNFAAQRGKPVDDLGVQLDFLWQELQGPENAAFQALKGTRSAYEAAATFENKFERPAANHNAERGAIAQQVLRELGRGDTATA